MATREHLSDLKPVQMLFQCLQFFSQIVMISQIVSHYFFAMNQRLLREVYTEQSERARNDRWCMNGYIIINLIGRVKASA